MSSAYRRTLTLIPATLTPPKSSSTRSFINRENSKGLRMQPCLTPEKGEKYVLPSKITKEVLICHEKGWYFGVHNNHRSI